MQTTLSADQVIYNADDLSARVAKIVDEFGSALVEKYVDGREFSVLVAGAKGNIQVFPAVEYRFPKDRQPLGTFPLTASPLTTESILLEPPTASIHRSSDGGDSDLSTASSPPSGPGPAFITFEDKWGANFENRWFLLDEKEKELSRRLEEMALKLYEAFEGEGLARFDIRQDAASGKLLVLDCNPNCSMFYHDSCVSDTLLCINPIDPDVQLSGV
jgi:D-alanine-D-alanine ligase-like ATP-grasp enzyme